LSVNATAQYYHKPLLRPRQKSSSPTAADCGHQPIFSHHIARHVANPGGVAVSVCLRCLSKLHADEPRHAARHAFAALFVRPVPSGTGGALVVVVLVVPLAQRRPF